MTKKILFIQPYLQIGGVESVLINYLNAIVSSGNFKVELIILDELEKFNIEKINPNIPIHFLMSPAEAQFSRYTYWKLQDNSLSEKDRHYYQSWNTHIGEASQDRFLKKLEEIKPDVIVDFLNVFINFLGGKEFINKINIPIINWIHDDRYFNNVLYFKDKARMVLSKMENIVSICEDMKLRCLNLLQSELDLPNKNTSVLYNPLDIKKVIDLSQATLSEEEQQLLNDNYIVEVARLENGQKNLLQLIDIYAKLKQKGIKEKLYIIGDGPSREEIAQKIKELGLEEDCLLLGAKLNPFPFMKNAKVFVHTANYEGLPTVLIESQICGTPVVAFNCPTGPREILADGKYGELIPMGDEDLFVEKTYELLTNEEKRQHFISLLPQSYQRFSMEKISEQFNTLIQQVLNKE